MQTVAKAEGRPGAQSPEAKLTQPGPHTCCCFKSTAALSLGVASMDNGPECHQLLHTSPQQGPPWTDVAGGLRGPYLEGSRSIPRGSTCWTQLVL